jgi:hypothetical protein
MPDCPISPPPSLFDIETPFSPGLPHGAWFAWEPRDCAPLWVIAIVLVLVAGRISAAAFVAVRRRTTGTSGLVFSLLLAVGMLGVLAPTLYLLLVGLPDLYWDNEWHTGQIVILGDPPVGACAQLLDSIYQQHTMQRQVANSLAVLLGIASGVLWLYANGAVWERPQQTRGTQVGD